MKVAIFDVSTGRICRIFEGPESMVAMQAQAGEEWIACAEDTIDLSHWIDPTTLLRKDRLPMPGTLDKTQILADGTDLATIHNLPGCTVTFKGQQYPVEDGSFEFTADIPGTFIVAIEAFPYLPATFTVEAIDEN